MKYKANFYVACLVIAQLFSPIALAASAPVINIQIDKPSSIPFIFMYNKESHNICIQQSANLVKCTIYNKHVLGFILNLSWINPDKINCSTNLLLFGKGNNYIFQLSSAYPGSSFNPLQWDGTSDINTKLIIGREGCKTYQN